MSREIVDAQEAPKAFCADMVYDCLSSDMFVRGRQEDAQEFLGVVLEKLHQELCTEEDKLETETWMQAGSKKHAVTRHVTSGASLITQWFGGRMKSIVRTVGQPPSITIEPFQTLQLDIDVNPDLRDLYFESAISHHAAKFRVGKGRR